MHAEPVMDDGFLCSYADIVFRPEVAAALAAHPAELPLFVDPFWAEAYDGRSDHPIPEAELCAVQGPDDRVLRVGKAAVPPAQAIGEFTGPEGHLHAARTLREFPSSPSPSADSMRPTVAPRVCRLRTPTDLFNDPHRTGLRRTRCASQPAPVPRDRHRAGSTSRGGSGELVAVTTGESGEGAGRKRSERGREVGAGRGTLRYILRGSVPGWA